MDVPTGHSLGNNATFGDYLKLVEAGSITGELDRLAGVKGEPGEVAFGPARPEDKKKRLPVPARGQTTPTKELTPLGGMPAAGTPTYYKNDVEKTLLPDRLRAGYPVERGIRDPANNTIDWKPGRVYQDLGNGKWKIEDETGEYEVEFDELRGPKQALELQTESLARLKELAGVPESATGGATGAGSISGGTSMLGYNQSPTPNTRNLAKQSRKKRKSKEGIRKRANKKANQESIMLRRLP